MKLLTTIAALLLSFSAFSQDYIEYNEGKFSRNGEELSIEQIEKLTKELKPFQRVSANNLLHKGRRFNNIADNRLYRNSSAIIIAGIGGFSSAGLFAAGDIAEWFDWRELQIALYGLGVAIIPATIFASLKTSKPEHWLNARDESFERLAKKLNRVSIESK